MVKEAYWFRHDSNARSDWKILALRSVYGMEGYGRFWYLVEMMRESEDNTLPFDKKPFYYSLVSEWKISISDVKKFIDDCIFEFELFSSDDNSFWSDSLNNRLEAYTNQKIKRQEDGRKGGRPRKETLEQTQESTLQQEAKSDKREVEKPVRTKNATIAQFGSDVEYLTDLLIQKIKQNNDNAKKPSNIDSWRKDINSMIDIDKYNFEQIERMIEFSQADEFWKSNILSSKKLRDKAGTLILQMQRKKTVIRDESPQDMFKRLSKLIGEGEDDDDEKRNAKIVDVDAVVL